MGKLLVALLLLAVVLHLCSSEPGWRRGRGRDRNERMGLGMRNARHRHGGSWDLGFNIGYKDYFRRFETTGVGFGPRRQGFGSSQHHFDRFGPSTFEQWWKGPNVCFSMTEGVENDTAQISSHFSFQSVVCDGSDTTYKCTTTEMTSRGRETVVEVYECCHGFSRAQEDFGCLHEVPLLDISSLLETLHLSELSKLLDSSGLTSEVLSTDTNNLTIFAPSNDAVKSFIPLISQMEPGIDLKDSGSVIMVSKAINDAVVDTTRNLVLGHMIVGRLTLSHISDNQIIETASPWKTTIRMNIYQRPVNLVTANCKKVTSIDNIASNGVVHVIGDILKPVSETLLTLIQKNPELSTFKTALGSSGLAASLREDGAYTLFAPTDSAFKKHQQLMTKIVTNPDCMETMLKNHLLPTVICSSVIEGEARTSNALGRQTNLRRDADNKLYVDGAQIATSDIMATNGVMYIIDDVLIPDEALNILQLVERNDLVEFGKLVDLASMKKELLNVENITVFVPSDEAFKALPADIYTHIGKDMDALKAVLQYHIVPDILSSKMFHNNLQLDTLQGSQLRINEYSSFPFGRRWSQTVQCANIEKTVRGCTVAVYVIDKVLVPPSGNVIDILAQDSRFAILVELIKAAEIADLLQGTGPYTVFAPTNEAFASLGTDAVDELKQHPDTLKYILRNHVTKDSICCAGVTRANWFDSQKVRVLSGDVYQIGKTRGEDIFIGNANVIQCDLPATNGVVHVIDEVLTSPRHRRQWEWVWEF